MEYPNIGRVCQLDTDGDGTPNADPVSMRYILCIMQQPYDGVDVLVLDCYHILYREKFAKVAA